MKLEQHREEFLSLDVDEVGDIFVNMDRSLVEVIDEDQLNVIRDLDGVISLRNVHWMIPIDEINVRQNLTIQKLSIGRLIDYFYPEHHREDVMQNNQKLPLFSSFFVSKEKGRRECHITMKSRTSSARNARSVFFFRLADFFPTR